MAPRSLRNGGGAALEADRREPATFCPGRELAFVPPTIRVRSAFMCGLLKLVTADLLMRRKARQAKLEQISEVVLGFQGADQQLYYIRMNHIPVNDSCHRFRILIA
jgi:hypothetical protein